MGSLLFLASIHNNPSTQFVRKIVYVGKWIEDATETIQ